MTDPRLAALAAIALALTTAIITSAPAEAVQRDGRGEDRVRGGDGGRPVSRATPPRNNGRDGGVRPNRRAERATPPPQRRASPPPQRRSDPPPQRRPSGPPPGARGGGGGDRDGRGFSRRPDNPPPAIRGGGGGRGDRGGAEPRRPRTPSGPPPGARRGGGGGDRDGRGFSNRPTNPPPAVRGGGGGDRGRRGGGGSFGERPNNPPPGVRAGGGGGRDGRAFGARPDNPPFGERPRRPRGDRPFPENPRTDNPIREGDLYGNPRNRGGGYGFGRRGRGDGDGGYGRRGGDRDVGVYRNRRGPGHYRNDRHPSPRYRGGGHFWHNGGGFYWGGFYRNHPRPYRHGYWVDRRRDFWRDRYRIRSQTRWLGHLNYGWGYDTYYGNWGRPNRWRYHTTYYSRGYDRRQFAYYDGICSYRDNGDATVVGALLGAIIGGAAANDDDVVVGAILGAGIGGLFGNAVGRLDDCDKGQLHYAAQYAFEYGEPYYWTNPYTGVRGAIIIRDSYYDDGYECRWGDAEVYMPDGTFTYEQIRMCRDDYGEWFVAPYQY